jgi:hypothetical protein
LWNPGRPKHLLATHARWTDIWSDCRLCASSVQPYAEADANETAKLKADEDAKAAAKTNGASKAADAEANDSKDAKKVSALTPLPMYSNAQH